MFDDGALDGFGEVSEVGVVAEEEGVPGAVENLFIDFLSVGGVVAADLGFEFVVELFLIDPIEGDEEVFVE